MVVSAPGATLSDLLDRLFNKVPKGKSRIDCSSFSNLSYPFTPHRPQSLLIDKVVLSHPDEEWELIVKVGGGCLVLAGFGNFYPKEGSSSSPSPSSSPDKHASPPSSSKGGQDVGGKQASGNTKDSGGAGKDGKKSSGGPQGGGRPGGESCNLRMQWSGVWLTLVVMC